MFDKGFAGGQKDRRIFLDPGYYTRKDQFAPKAKHSDLRVDFHLINRSYNGEQYGFFHARVILLSEQ